MKKQILIAICLFLLDPVFATQAKGKFASESAINRSYAILFDAVNNVVSTLVNLSKVKYQNQEDDLVKVSTNVLFRVSETIKALNLSRKNQKLDIQVIEKLNDEIEQLVLLNSSLLKLVINDMDGHDYECDSGDCQRNDAKEIDDEFPLDEGDESAENREDIGDSDNTIQSMFKAALADDGISQNTDENDEEITEHEADDHKTIQEIFSDALGDSTQAKTQENAHISIQNIFKNAL